MGAECENEPERVESAQVGDRRRINGEIQDGDQDHGRESE